jgi:hypothetical protein
MAIYIEDNLPNIRENGLNTTKNTSLGGTLAVTGVATFTAAPVFTAAPTGPTVRATSSSALVGATVVLTAADSGKVFINRSTSASPSWTLPAAADGLTYTFVVSNTTTGFTVTAAGTIYAKTSATGTAVSGTTLTNTQATAVVGDTITLTSNGTGWLMTAQSGIFTAA